MRVTCLGGLLLIFASVPAQAQQIGEAERGLRYAESVCSACHAVHANQIVSPVERAPPFQLVARASGMTANALSAWLQTSHPTMPNVIMTSEDRRNVIEYILSLKAK
jgi:mono/diheme cytochrome c family protein